MKFTCSTKPLQNALKLGVIKSNISKFYQKSCLAKITCTQDSMRVNLEASRIVTQLTLHGSGDEAGPVAIFVDCQVFSDLVSTFDSDVVTFEFVEGGVAIHAGKSRFTLPRVLDDSEDVDLDLAAPRELDPNAIHKSIDVNAENWKFINDHQMFAIAINYIHPVYCRVWVGDGGDVLVGDYSNSVFTHSNKGSLGRTCLLPTTIINLFTSLPEGSKMIDTGSSYIVKVSTDGYEYVTEFTPELESDENVGSYNSDIFMGLFSKKDKFVTVEVPKITKFLNQAAYIITYDSLLDFVVSEDSLFIGSNDVKCNSPITSSSTVETYSCKFKANFLKSVFSNLDAESVNIAPKFSEGENGEKEVSGVLFWTDDVSVLLGAIE